MNVKVKPVDNRFRTEQEPFPPMIIAKFQMGGMEQLLCGKKGYEIENYLYPTLSKVLRDATNLTSVTLSSSKRNIDSIYVDQQ